MEKVSAERTGVENLRIGCIDICVAKTPPPNRLYLYECPKREDVARGRNSRYQLLTCERDLPDDEVLACSTLLGGVPKVEGGGGCLTAMERAESVTV
jgi:hypothetical protein